MVVPQEEQEAAGGEYYLIGLRGQVSTEVERRAASVQKEYRLALLHKETGQLEERGS